MSPSGAAFPASRSDSSFTGSKAKPVSSCPTEDTQNRLKAGIPQTSVDDAQDTISKYRHQIDEEQTRQVIDAQTIRDNTDQRSTSESDSEKTAEQSAEAEASDKN